MTPTHVPQQDALQSSQVLLRFAEEKQTAALVPLWAVGTCFIFTLIVFKIKKIIITYKVVLDAPNYYYYFI